MEDGGEKVAAKSCVTGDSRVMTVFLYRCTFF